MSNIRDVTSSKKNYDEFRTSIGLRLKHEAEIKRLRQLHIYTTDADAIRDIMDKGINTVLEALGLQPLDYKEMMEYNDGEVVKA